ncbi:MAG: serine/threonine-protein kinase [Gemmatimonadaceae bacterium]|jgi:serine/threonine protein kinase
MAEERETIEEQTAGGERELLALALGPRYSIVRLLGRGGMGAVHLARDNALQRLVAIKTLLPEYASDPERRTTFRGEALSNARLAHPNIVPVYGVEERDGFVAMVMRYVHGPSLAYRLWKGEPMPPDEVCRILADLASALDYAHRSRVVHRDIKPENVLLDRETGTTMLTDFGVARSASLDALSIAQARAEQGMVRGTPHYMSPEQAAGELALDGRSDLYSLGVLGYLMISGRHPFEGARTVEMPSRHIAHEPIPLGEIAPGAPAEIVAIIAKCLEKAPEDRWSDGRVLRESLIEAGVPLRKSTAPRVARWIKGFVSRYTPVSRR